MVIIKIKETEYKLELKARMAESVERKLSCKSLLTLFTPTEIKQDGKGNIQQGAMHLPALSDMLAVLWGCIQVNAPHNKIISVDEVCDLYDEWTKEKGNNAFQLFSILGEACHFFTSETQEKTQDE